MKWFSDPYTDERIVNIQNKVFREVSLLTVLICLVSIAAKAYIRF